MEQQRQQPPRGAGLDTAANFASICRTCAASTEYLMPIYHGEGLQNSLADKIRRHLPIQVCESDVLPLQLCYQCASTLLAWHELVTCCAQADAALRTRLARLQELATYESNVPTTSKDEIPNEKSELLEQKEKWTETHDTNLQKRLEAILLSYKDSSQKLNPDTAQENIIYVCQKCEIYSPFHTIATLAEHLEEYHFEEVTDESSMSHFITENLILVESLETNPPDQVCEVEFEKEAVWHGEKHLPEQTENSDDLKKLCCPFCQQIFSSPKRLANHLHIHKEVSLKNGYACNCCAVTFCDLKLFVAHLQEAHVMLDLGEKQDVCRSCAFICDSKEELQLHVNNSHADNTVIKVENTRKTAKNAKYISVDCPKCNRTLSNKYNLANHIRLVHEGRAGSFSCDECSKPYRSRSSLQDHIDTIHKGKLRYFCAVCGEAFPYKSNRDVHMRIHTGETPYQCQNCTKTFRSKNSLVSHMMSHLNVRQYRCGICARKFRKSSHLKYHLGCHRKTASTTKLDTVQKALQLKCEQVAEEEAQAQSVCENAEQEPANTSSSTSLGIQYELNKITLDAVLFTLSPEDIIISDDGRKYFLCRLCNKTTSLGSWKRHMRRHSGERRYRCASCGIGFGDAGNLARHTRNIHQHLRNHTCTYCAESFTRKSHLDDHMQRHTGGREFVCDVCGKTSKSSSALRIHKKIHENVYRFQCVYCNKLFKRQQELNAHVSVHTGERAHSCACGHTFRLQSQLRAHARTHEPAHTTYQCDSCTKIFKQKRYLTHHIRDKHKH